MSIQEIKSAYPNEWVMLGDYQKDGMNVTGGDVLAHHPDKKTLLRNAPDWRRTHQIATHIFTGEFEKRKYWL